MNQDTLLLNEFWIDRTIDELIEEQNIHPIQNFDEIWGQGKKLWDSDEEFEVFIRSITDNK